MKANEAVKGDLFEARDEPAHEGAVGFVELGGECDAARGDEAPVGRADDVLAAHELLEVGVRGRNGAHIEAHRL